MLDRATLGIGRENESLPGGPQLRDLAAHPVECFTLRLRGRQLISRAHRGEPAFHESACQHGCRAGGELLRSGDRQKRANERRSVEMRHHRRRIGAVAVVAVVGAAVTAIAVANPGTSTSTILAPRSTLSESIQANDNRIKFQTKDPTDLVTQQV